ncbi:hypothetical protein HDU67_003853 [Dinochytrium kinnereticum]|nr:hypothetical protein HDU67_003853 [Dinochytrium kinnereticum]
MNGFSRNSGSFGNQQLFPPTPNLSNNQPGYHSSSPHQPLRPSPPPPPHPPAPAPQQQQQQYMFTPPGMPHHQQPPYQYQQHPQQPPHQFQQHPQQPPHQFQQHPIQYHHQQPFPQMTRTPSREPSAALSSSSASTAVNASQTYPQRPPTEMILSMIEDAERAEEKGNTDLQGRILTRIVDYATMHLGDTHEATLTAILGLAEWFEATEDSAVKIEGLVRKGLENARGSLGNDHHVTLGLMGSMAGVFDAQELSNSAYVLLVERAERARKVFGEAGETFEAEVAVVVWLASNERFEEAERMVRPLILRAGKVLGENHAGTFQAYNLYGMILVGVRRFADAETYLSKALNGMRGLPRDEVDEEVLTTLLGTLATSLWKQLKLDQSEALLMEGISRSVRLLGQDDPQTLDMTKELQTVRRLKEYQGKAEEVESRAMLLAAKGEVGRAEKMLRECVEAHTRLYGATHGRTLEAGRKLEEVMRMGKGGGGGGGTRVSVTMTGGAAAVKKKKRNFFGF